MPEQGPLIAAAPQHRSAMEPQWTPEDVKFMQAALAEASLVLQGRD